MTHTRDSEGLLFFCVGNHLAFWCLICCAAPCSEHAELSLHAGQQMDKKGFLLKGWEKKLINGCFKCYTYCTCHVMNQQGSAPSFPTFLSCLVFLGLFSPQIRKSLCTTVPARATSTVDLMYIRESSVFLLIHTDTHAWVCMSVCTCWDLHCPSQIRVPLSAKY